MSSFATISETALPISAQPTSLQPSPSCLISGVRNPSSRMASTASSRSWASSGRSRSYRSIIAAERIMASGFALSWPAMSGAEPWQGSKTPGPDSPKLADGSMPNDPTSIDASSERISPKILPHTMVSNCFGHLMSCIAALSTYMWLSSTSGKSFVMTSVTTSRQSWDTSSTFALSTLQSLPPLLLATSPATRAMRSISLSE
mmetsp:Transcript_16001/g.32839  ORF Transcript_16001/g.32839 Transcript_16001/m.32839 type:complete len:202 (+) Transcript_16001:121-726(+)